MEALISEMKVAQDVDKIPDVSADPNNENNNDVKEVRIFSVNVHMEYINSDISNLLQGQHERPRKRTQQGFVPQQKLR